MEWLGPELALRGTADNRSCRIHASERMNDKIREATGISQMPIPD